MNGLDVTVVTSRKYIPCQSQSCVITILELLLSVLRIMHACTFKMSNKKEKKNHFALFVNISFYPDAGGFVSLICCFTTV